MAEGSDHRAVSRVHFVGIGGVGMSALAELLHRDGLRVTGSDIRISDAVVRLRDLGIEVSIGHAPEAVREADAVVYSSAIAQDDPELAEARRRSLPLVRRGELLAEQMHGRRGIAVGGTHGKTTTASLLAHTLASAGLDPVAVIGGAQRGGARPGSGLLAGRGPLMVVESDESDGSFLHLRPEIAIVTSIDPEHLDHYGNVAALESAFVDFANAVPMAGLVVLCGDHPGSRAIGPRLRRRAITYGTDDGCDLLAEGVEHTDLGARFLCRRAPRRTTPTEILGEVKIPLPGSYNVLNALATIAVALELGIEFADIAAALATFGGVARRFETKGVVRGVRVVDDYGHHPTEVRAMLGAARAAHAGRVVTVFQPHRYTRTRDLFDDFAASFRDADRLVVCDVYPAGEEPIAEATGERLAHAIRAQGQMDVAYVPTLDEIAETLPSELRSGDLVITLGAGDVSALGPRLLARLGETGP